MKRLLSLISAMLIPACILTFSLASCNAKNEEVSGTSVPVPEAAVVPVPEAAVVPVPEAAAVPVPEDFSFTLTWNCFGLSSYDSRTGKLVKTTDAKNPDDFTTYYQLGKEDREYFYKLIKSLDLNSYPDEYDPGNGISKPSMTLILGIYENGTQKTVKAEGIAISFESKDEKGQKFLWVCEEISGWLAETDEWKALPPYEVLYD